MPVDILITILAVSVVQSVFGVGTLLFGTPILLLLGYDFVNALGVLLPVSIAISTLQLIKHYEEIDTVFYKKLVIYSLPLVVIFLALVTMVKISIGLAIGAVLVVVALKSFFPPIERALLAIMKYERIYFMVLGLIHGISNLGGSLLTAVIYAKNYSKDKARVTGAASYATLALVQLLTLLLMGTEFSISYADKAFFVQVGIIMFLMTEEMLYGQIANAIYAKLFAIFLFVSGIMLIIKSL
jgi:uncharacterized membrane protein YfcA